MDAARQFSVMTTGTIKPGFDEAQVATDFATLLCSPMETAQTFINAKKCVAADIDEDRALIYEESLNEIGLQVVLIPTDRQDAANDPTTIVVPEVPEVPDDHHAAYECKAPSATILTDSVVVDLRPPETYELDEDHTRVYRLAFLGVLAAILAGFIYTTRDQVSATVSQFGDQAAHTVEAKASEDIVKLLELSGLNAQFAGFADSLPAAFEDYLDPLVDSDPLVTREAVNQVLRHVPEAFHTEALQASVGNRLNRMTYASDIVGLIDIYEDPVVQTYIKRVESRNVYNDRTGLERFKQNLENKPLSSPRRTAVSAIVDAMGLDKATLDIKRDLNRNFIATASELRPNKDTPETKGRVLADIKLMREQIGAESNDIRLEVIATLAWQHEDADIAELHQLRNALDRSMVRTLFRETSIAYETFMRDATLWLHRELDEG